MKNASSTQPSLTYSYAKVYELILQNQISLRIDTQYHIKVWAKTIIDELDFEDLISDINLKAFQAAGRFDPSRSSIRTWMSMIARNAVIDLSMDLCERRWGLVRKDLSEVPESRILASCTSEDYYSAGKIAQERQQEESRREALSRLNSTDRKIVEMYLSGKSGREMASVLGISEGALRKRVADVKARIQKHLRELDQQ